MYILFLICLYLIIYASRLSTQHFVNHAILLSLLSGHPIVAIRVSPYLVELCVRVFDKVWADSDRDYWMTAQEAKEYGMIDEVLCRKP